MACQRPILAELAGLAADANCQLNCQQTEQRGELDHRIHRYRRSILERIADGVTDYHCIVQRCAFLFHLDFDDFLRVIPRAAGIGHKDRLIQTKDSDRNQIADEEERLDEREGERRKKDTQEDIEHSSLRIPGADFHDLLAVLYGSFFGGRAIFVACNLGSYYAWTVEHL